MFAPQKLPFIIPILKCTVFSIVCLLVFCHILPMKCQPHITKYEIYQCFLLQRPYGCKWFTKYSCQFPKTTGFRNEWLLSRYQTTNKYFPKEINIWLRFSPMTNWTTDLRFITFDTNDCHWLLIFTVLYAVWESHFIGISHHESTQTISTVRTSQLIRLLL